MQRRLPHHQDEAPPLLEDHVRGAREQRRGHPGRDLRHRADRAGRHHHADGLERAARNGSGDVVDLVPLIRQRADIADLGRSLVRHRDFGGAGYDQMRLDRRLTQQLQQADAVDYAGRAGDAYDQSGRRRHGFPYGRRSKPATLPAIAAEAKPLPAAFRRGRISPLPVLHGEGPGVGLSADPPLADIGGAWRWLEDV